MMMTVCISVQDTENNDDDDSVCICAGCGE